MKNIFILNPTAGSTRKLTGLIHDINKACKENNVEHKIYYTKCAGDSEVYIHKICEEYRDEEIRFFGAGGDGTLNEIVNACHEHTNAVAAIIPIGTGNDFVRAAGGRDKFLDIDAQLKGKAVPIDLIRCEYEEDGVKKIRYCDNMINIGFDSNVVAKAAQIRKRGVVTGSLAYLLGVGVILVEKKGADLRIELDDGFVHDGPLLLTAAANGNYCGGGVCSSPFSVLDDGLIEVSVIHDMSRSRFVSLYPSYSKGTHFDRKGADELLDYHKVKKAHIRTNGEPMKVSNDGEIVLTDEIFLEVEPLSVKFNMPDGI